MNSEIVSDQFVEIWPGKGDPEISILMPIYNQMRYVSEAVNSILAQRGIIAEIIISDDASSDETFDIAHECVSSWLSRNGSQHRIIMRRSQKRLWRDHVALLADNASCDLVFQAHGDDESHPDRARILAGVFNAKSNISMLATESYTVNAAGELLDERRSVDSQFDISRYSYDSIINGHHFLIGYSQAWRRSAVSRFKRLDRNLAAVSHDRILSFRAALVGEVCLIKAQLIKRRLHSLSAHNMMFYEPGTKEQFGWGLACLTRLVAMKQDLSEALNIEVINKSLYSKLALQIDQLKDRCIISLLEAHRMQLLSGRQIAWVEDEMMLNLKRNRNL